MAITENQREVLKKISEYELFKVLGYFDPIWFDDINFMREAINIEPVLLQHASPAVKDNEDIVSLSVEKVGRMLEHASTRLQSSLAVVQIAVATDGNALKYAPTLNDNEGVVSQAVQQNGLAIQFACPQLQASKTLGLLAVKQNGDSLQYLDDDLRADPDVVKAAVKQDGFSLKYAEESLQGNKSIVLEAVTQKGWALEFAAKPLQKDPQVILRAIKQYWAAAKFVDIHALTDNINNLVLVLDNIECQSEVISIWQEKLNNDSLKLDVLQDAITISNGKNKSHGNIEGFNRLKEKYAQTNNIFFTRNLAQDTQDGTSDDCYSEEKDDSKPTI